MNIFHIGEILWHWFFVNFMVLCFSSSNNDEAEKMAMIEKHMTHLKRAEEARIYMNKCIEQARKLVGNLCLEYHAPLSGPEYGHYGFDFAQQVSIV